MLHIAQTFSLLSLYRKFPSISPIRLNPPLVILLRRWRYVTSNFSNWPTVKFQFWHYYVSLLLTKLFIFISSTLVLSWILEFWRLVTLREKCPNTELFLVRIFLCSCIWTLLTQCHGSKFSVCYLDTVINFNVFRCLSMSFNVFPVRSYFCVCIFLCPYFPVFLYLDTFHAVSW